MRFSTFYRHAQRHRRNEQIEPRWTSSRPFKFAVRYVREGQLTVAQSFAIRETHGRR